MGGQWRGHGVNGGGGHSYATGGGLFFYSFSLAAIIYIKKIIHLFLGNMYIINIPFHVALFEYDFYVKELCAKIVFS